MSEQIIIHSPTTQLLSSPVGETLLTGANLLEMGDIGPCELVEGRIVLMSPTKMPHGRLEYHIARIIGNFVEDEHDLGEVMVGEIGIYTHKNPDTVRGADVLYISHERLAQNRGDGFLEVAPELIVEVMSTNDRWVDVRKKLREYFAIGVVVVLVVEPKERLVSLFRSPTQMQELREQDMLIMEDILPGFQVSIADLLTSHKQR